MAAIAWAGGPGAGSEAIEVTGDSPATYAYLAPRLRATQAAAYHPAK